MSNNFNKYEVYLDELKKMFDSYLENKDPAEYEIFRHSNMKSYIVTKTIDFVPPVLINCFSLKYYDEDNEEHSLEISIYKHTLSSGHAFFVFFDFITDSIDTDTSLNYRNLLKYYKANILKNRNDDKFVKLAKNHLKNYFKDTFSASNSTFTDNIEEMKKMIEPFFSEEGLHYDLYLNDHNFPKLQKS